jgi:uncharacterized membrane protein YphA (DoxX/SURF4 family)
MALGALLILSGMALLLGLFTAVASVSVGCAAIGSALSWLPAPMPNVFDAALPAALVAILAVAIALLGPGAWSVDARLFGFRQIIIAP